MFGLAFLIVILAGLAGGAALAFRSKSEEGPGEFRSVATIGLWSAGVLLTGAGASGMLRRLVPSDDLFRTETVALARALSYLAVGIPLVAGLSRQITEWLKRRQGGVGWVLGWPTVLLWSTIAAAIGWAQAIAWLAGGDSSPEGVGKMIAWSVVSGATIQLERRHRAWWGDAGRGLYAFLLPVVSVAFLITAFVGLGLTLIWIATGDPQPEALGRLVPFGLLWWVTRELERRLSPGHHLTALGWGAVGLVTATIGGFGFLLNLFRMVAGSVFDQVTIGDESDLVIRWGCWALVGLALWLWLWLGDVLRRPETVSRRIFALLAAVTPSTVVLISAAAGVAFLVAEWFLGTPETASPATQFEMMPDLMAALLVAWGVFLHHRRVAHVPDPTDRPARYIVAGIGVFAGGIGLVQVVAAIVVALGGAVLVGDRGVDILLGGLTAIVAGGSAWLTQIRVMERRVTDDPTERAYPIRKLYLGSVLVVSALAFMASVIGFLFQLFQVVLGSGSLRSEDTAVSIGVLVSAALIGWNHWQTWKEDRRHRPQETAAGTRPAPTDQPRQVMMVTGGDPTGLRTALAGTANQLWVWSSPDAADRSVDEFRTALGTTSATRVLLIGRDQTVEVIELDR